MSDVESVVVGVGNPTMRDDGVGHRVVDELADSEELSENVELHRTATSSFLALEAISGADTAVVVDAVDADGPPGTVYRYRFVDGEFEGDVPDVLMHDLSFADALRAGREAYDVPPEVTIIGVQPRSLSVGLGLTDAVENAVPVAVDVALATLDAAAKRTRTTDGATP